MFDLLYRTDYEQLMVSTQLTASKTDVLVVDTGAFGIQAKPIGSLLFLVNVNAIATADATTNYFTFNLYHSANKTSSTALTSGVLVTATTGLLNAASPVIQATTLTTQDQKNILVGYRGIKRYVQIQPTETGTADITVSIHAIGGFLDSEHGNKLD